MRQSRRTFLRETLVCVTLAGHSCITLTLVGHSSGTLLWGTLPLVGHSCETLFYDTLVGHSCGTLLWGTLVGHSCRTLLWDTLVGLCRTLLRGNSCGTPSWGTTKVSKSEPSRRVSKTSVAYETPSKLICLQNDRFVRIQNSLQPLQKTPAHTPIPMSQRHSTSTTCHERSHAHTSNARKKYCACHEM